MQHQRDAQTALAEQLEIRRASFLQALLMEAEEPKPVIKLDDWEAEMQQQTVSREDLNELVMDYLVSEECKEAAEAFQEEANVHSNFLL